MGIDSCKLSHCGRKILRLATCIHVSASQDNPLVQTTSLCCSESYPVSAIMSTSYLVHPVQTTSLRYRTTANYLVSAICPQVVSPTQFKPLAFATRQPIRFLLVVHKLPQIMSIIKFKPLAYATRQAKQYLLFAHKLSTSYISHLVQTTSLCYSTTSSYPVYASCPQAIHKLYHTSSANQQPKIALLRDIQTRLVSASAYICEVLSLLASSILVFLLGYHNFARQIFSICYMSSHCKVRSS